MVQHVENRAASLLALDLAHLVHPQQSDADQQNAVVLAKGEGAILWDVDGRRYLDGLSCLWNVNVGHGRRELAEAAERQMSTLAFASAYAGTTSEPAIALAARLAKLAPEGLNSVFFTTGGAESNDTAFKTARYYWHRMGKPTKVKILSRLDGYHGVTIGALAATGMSVYWDRFGPLSPGFGQVEAMSPEALEARIKEEGPDTVAAFIAEPVQGAGGVNPPPDDYFPRVREICDRYEVLLIADEVITGFGRTGRYWGLQHWNVRPDMLSFAKGVTSGYQPLGGVIFSDAIRDSMRAADARWMHAYTYSGHPTCGAVALANLDIIEREGLVERAARGGKRLLAGLAPLRDHPKVAAVRGLGMMAAVELEAGSGLGPRALAEARKRGLLARVRGDIICLAPPLVTSDAEIDEITTIVRASVEAVVS